MSHDVPQTNDVRQDLLHFRLRAVAEIGPQIFLVEVAYVQSTELCLEPTSRRSLVAAGTPPAHSFAFQYG